MSKFHRPVSKLPNEKASIFSIMGQMAKEYGAIDLSQGYPDFASDRQLQELVYKAMRQGFNQYAPLAGVLELREQITLKIKSLHQKEYNPETEVTVTNGATQALFLAISALVFPRDEVIVLKPAYDSYEPAIELNGGIPVVVPLLGPDYEIDWIRLEEKIGPRTRMLIINNPHNPSGRVWKKQEMQRLSDLLKGTDIILLSDEVYEHLIFDDLQHISASSIPGLAHRAIVCASFGKTFHNTGWKMGYCVGPKELMKEIRKVHQVNAFCVHHPTQIAFAQYLKEPAHYRELPRFYQEKRDYFLEIIKGSRFRWKPTEGTYFQILEYKEITQEPDVIFAERLVKQYGLAVIPVSVFNYEKADWKQLRFCFAKKEDTLDRAAEIILKL